MSSEPPRFSIIIPIYRVADHLDECLRSVVEQSFRDFEILAVDDCSPDRSGELIDKFSRLDERVSPIHLRRNVGLSSARNTGIARARGRYLVFLDGDDTLTDGSLAAMASRLDELSHPDVLVYDFRSVRPCGLHTQSRNSRSLPANTPGTFSLREVPEAIRFTWAAWNKAYSADFIRSRRIVFPQGLYEDTVWSCTTMGAAHRIGILDDVCIQYRKCRHGSIMRTVTRRQFEVFDRYHEIFSFFEANPSLQFANWRLLVLEKMVGFLRTFGGPGGAVPECAREEFYQRCRSLIVATGGSQERFPDMFKFPPF